MPKDTENDLPPKDHEHEKLLIDFFKHQTTLCTATIVVFLAIAGNLFPQPMSNLLKALIGTGSVAILCAMGAAFLALVDINMCYKDAEESKHWKGNMVFSAIAFLIGLFSFLLALLLGN
ncbi:hypothetical protein Mal35_33250 [Gimesia maris]|uniref:hypothetical protein n=1 Tax=Gimesia maris TaxID=122 RepID=UPI0011884744|nr:hypothetical protein [Gimesia maris]QDT79856.1 hypothetical protein Mal35_33250 [Gimesia maris]